MKSVSSTGRGLLAYQVASLVLSVGVRTAGSRPPLPGDHAHLVGLSGVVILSWATLLGARLGLLNRLGALLSGISRARVPAAFAYWLPCLLAFHWLGMEAMKGA